MTRCCWSRWILCELSDPQGKEVLCHLPEKQVCQHHAPDISLEKLAEAVDTNTPVGDIWTRTDIKRFIRNYKPEEKP